MILNYHIGHPGHASHTFVKLQISTKQTLSYPHLWIYFLLDGVRLSGRFLWEVCGK